MDHTQFPNQIPRRAYVLMIFDAMVEFRRKLVKIIIPVVAMLGLTSALINNPYVVYSIAALVCLVSSVLYIRNYHRIVNDTLICIKRGVGNVLTESIKPTQIERMEVYHSFVSRILGLSTAELYSPGSELPAITLHYLTNQQLRYVVAKWGKSKDHHSFNYASTLRDTLKAIFLPSFIKLFPQSLILLTLLIALVTGGDFGAHLTDRTDMLSTLSSGQKLGEGGHQDQLLASATNIKTLAISFALFYLSSILARFLFLFPTMSNVVVYVTDKELFLKRGLFVEKTTSIPINRIAKVRYSDSVYSHLMGGYQLTIDTVSSSDSQVSIPFISKVIGAQLLSQLHYPEPEIRKVQSSSFMSSLVYSALATKYTTPFSILFGTLAFMTSKQAHFDLLIIVSAMFALPFLANLFSAMNAALIASHQQFLAMREFSVQPVIALFPKTSVALSHETSTTIGPVQYVVKRIVIGGHQTVLPTFST